MTVPQVRLCRAEPREQTRASGKLESHAGLWVVPEGELRCACGSDDLLAIKPGADDIYSETGILIARGRSTIAWCAACMLKGQNQ